MSHADGHVYEACGLVIASDAPIRGWRPASHLVPADVSISMQGERTDRDAPRDYPAAWYCSPELTPSGTPEMMIEAGPSGYRLRYGDDASFLVSRAGDRIVARWIASLTDHDAASYLSGSVLAFVLRVRGLVPLHASAVVVNGKGLLFAGDSWSGKSSIAAAFSSLGHAVLSDDIVRVDAGRRGLVAYPGHPRLNVWADSAAAVFGAAVALPMHSHTYEKRYVEMLEAGALFQSTPVSIGAVYVLAARHAAGQAPMIRDLPPREALIALVRHTYGGCFLDGEMRAREFDVISRLVERVPVRELTLGDDLGMLASSCRVLAAESARLKRRALPV